MKFLDKIKGWASYAPVLSFLALEIIAFVMFSMGDSFILYGILGLVLLALLVLLTCYQYKKKQLLTYVVFAFPIVVYGLLLAITNYSRSEVSVPLRVFTPIALITFATCGYLISSFKSFRVKYLIYTIYGVLALITLLDLVMTLIQYGAFYTIKYPYYFTYYNGNISRVALNNTAYGLIGFSYQKITLEYYSLFPTLLLTSVIALFFISPKKNRTEFIIMSCFALLAILALVFTLSKVMITGYAIALVVISFFICYAKFKKLRNKVTHGIIIGLACLFVLFLIVFTMNANNVGWIKNITTSNRAFNYLFNTNRFSANYKQILNGIFSKDKLIGFAPYIIVEPYEAIVYPSGNWLIDQFMYGGLFAFIFFLIFMLYFFRSLWLYKKSTRDSYLEKTLLLALICVYFGYTFIYGSVLRMANFTDQLPLFLSGPFLVMMFLYGYTYSVTERKWANE